MGLEGYELLHCVSELVADRLGEESDHDGSESLLAQSGQTPRLASFSEGTTLDA